MSDDLIENGGKKEDWYQSCLPSPPVPSLDHSLDRYLEYAAVVAAGTGASMAITNQAVKKFRTEGQIYQNAIIEMAKNNVNWVTPIWLSEMYLKIRAPLPVNTNPAYIFPKQTFEGLDDQLKYTALLIRGFMEFRELVLRKDIERELSTGREKIRMCMEQYDKVLGSYRMPFKDQDVHIPKQPSVNEHVLVMCNNQTFTIPVRHKRELLSTATIVKLLNQVVNRSKNRSRSMVVPVGASTAGDRDIAAEFWGKMMPQNEKSLSAIQQALFAVCLDIDHESNDDNTKEAELIARGNHLLHGFGSQNFGLNRWYDATIQIISSSLGWSGLCIEHSVAEGIVIVKMVEYALDFVKKNIGKKLISPEKIPYTANTLSWSIGSEERQLLDKQIELFNRLSNDIDLEVLIFEDFGKEFVKSKGVSPDGFAQLALQLAHYKLHHRLVSTYESATHRRFAMGRVDNIRANTPEALAWVTSMEDPKSTQSDRLLLFRRAAEKQAKVTMENISGYGIDNHLCALWVEARDRSDQIDLPELFVDPMWNELMRFPLSTSQVTTSSSLPLHDCYLCYGAVVDDGYGCAYNIQPDHFIFAPTAFRSCRKTNVQKMKSSLIMALQDMAKLLENK